LLIGQVTIAEASPEKRSFSPSIMYLKDASPDFGPVTPGLTVLMIPRSMNSASPGEPFPNGLKPGALLRKRACCVWYITWRSPI